MSPQAPEQREDAELLAAYVRGEAPAFAALVARHQRPLYNFVLRSVRDPERASDITQDVFVRIVQGAAGFHGQSRFTTWMYSIARNACIDHARRMRHRRHASLDAPTDPTTGTALGERIAGEGPSIERVAESNNLQGAISAAVEDLPEEQREVFLMRHVQGLAFGEIASVVGVSENTVKSRMRYALERLQGALAPYSVYKNASE